MRNYIVEFTGTFFLVLTVALTGNPIAIGAVLIAMVYMGGFMSGAHYNPAVTLAVLVRGRIGLTDAIGYMASQILAGFAAAAVFMVIKESLFVPQLGAGVTFVNAGTLEVLYTMALGLVVLHVATTKETKDNQYYGLAIGLTVMAAAFAAGPISGGVFNPAVAIGPILLDTVHIQAHAGQLATFIIGPLAGGALAGLIFRLLHGKSR